MSRHFLKSFPPQIWGKPLLKETSYPSQGTKYHMRIADGNNKVILKKMFCQCLSCSQNDFENCETSNVTSEPWEESHAVLNSAVAAEQRQGSLRSND